MARPDDMDRKAYLDRLEAEGNRAVIMVGIAAVGSVVLMFLIEKIF